MKFSIALPTERVDAVDEFVTGDAVTEIAAAVEAAGYDGCFVTDHPAPDGKWLAAGGHHALDPFVALSFAAASTARIRLQTHILVLPYRNPLLAAKSILSLDVLSGGRVIVGGGAGYLKPEFAALGVDFDERNELSDEAIDVMKAAWTQDEVVYVGHRFHTRGTSMLPRPVSRPHPPIWVGGNSKTAMRRAVDRGDGWVPFFNPAAAGRAVRTPTLETFDELEERLSFLRTYAGEVGRSAPMDVCFSLLSLRGQDQRGYDEVAVIEELARLEELGITWATVGFGARTRAEYLDRARAFAESVIVQIA